MAVQLTLFDLATFQVTCPDCGRRFHPEAEIDRHIKGVLEQEVVKRLPAPSRVFLRLSPREFLLGYPTGVALWEQTSVYSRSAAFKQLHKLMVRGLVVAEKKVGGGTYHQYRLVLPNQETSGNKIDNSRVTV